MPTLFLVIFVNVLGFGLIIPLLPFYIERLGGGPEIVTLLISMYALIQFALAPWIGRLSDRYGRRPILAWTTAGTIVAHVVLAFADSLWLVILSRALGGVMAGNLGVAFAYAADVTTKQDRAKQIGRLTTGFTLGFTFGPALGGLMAGTDMATANFLVPALAAAGLSAVAWLCVLLFLPESLKPEDRMSHVPNARGPTMIRQLTMMFRVEILALLAIVSFLLFMAWSAMLSIFALWANRMLEQGPTEIGFMFMWMGLVGAATQFTLIGPMTQKYGDLAVILLTSICMLAGMVLLALTSTLWMALLALTLLSVSHSIFTPVSTNLVTQNAAPKERGALLGIFQSVGSLGRVVGPAFSGFAFAALGYASPFHIGALVMVPCCILVFIAMRRNAMKTASV